jgi:hypothetical protein
MLVRDFKISPAASAGIAKWRDEWNRRMSDPAAAVWIGWGVSLDQTKKSFPGPIVSFYGESQKKLVDEHAVLISGEKIIFFVTDETSKQLEGKVLDFDDAHGFTLRVP